MPILRPVSTGPCPFHLGARTRASVAANVAQSCWSSCRPRCSTPSLPAPSGAPRPRLRADLVRRATAVAASPQLVSPQRSSRTSRGRGRSPSRPRPRVRLSRPPLRLDVLRTRRGGKPGSTTCVDGRSVSPPIACRSVGRCPAGRPLRTLLRSSESSCSQRQRTYGRNGHPESAWGAR